jgi:hypothetical protein
VKLEPDVARPFDRHPHFGIIPRGEDEMNRLSSRSTFVTKRVFPILWFGFVGMFFVSSLIASLSGEAVPVQFLIFPLVMAGFGYFVMKNLVLDLVDEVWDAGSELVVKNKGSETRVLLSEIVNVSYSVATSPQRVTLTLRHPTALGKEITFVAPATWIPFAKSPVVEKLIERIDTARGVGS